VTRKRERIRLPESADGKDTAYDFECLNFPVSEPQINCYHAEFSANLQPRHHAHEGMEFLYVTTGQLAISFPEEEVLLSAGDSVCFDSSAPHAYRKAGAESCTALVVTYPTARAAEAVTAADILRLHTREIPWKRAS
jgi:mannose-6-phosphate isomerase-like protein (cupin superfamily)